MPEGYKLENNIIFGKHNSHKGLFEIKIHNPKRRNAVNKEAQAKLAEVIHLAEADEEVKVIMLHGGKYYSSGNDISIFMQAAGESIDELKKQAKQGIEVVMVNMVLAVAFCKKPIVAVVRGECHGVMFTMLSHATLVYVAPDAKFRTPFMESA